MDPMSDSSPLAIGKGFADNQNPVNRGPNPASADEERQRQAGGRLRGKRGGTENNQKDASDQSADLQKCRPDFPDVESVRTKYSEKEGQ
jgi:hypothetical protein